LISIRLLGCNGGIGGTTRQSTCYLLGDRVLIDAGTGLGTLPLEQMQRIDHVVLTHAHLDHIACLPLLVDSVAAQREAPIQVWALPGVTAILSDHIFNDKIWPDFTQIPSPEQPFMQLNTLPEMLIVAGMRITALPAHHGIPACGLRVEREGIAVAFSGDTADCPAFWAAVNNDPALRSVIVECSYPAAMKELALLSMHLDTSALLPRLRELPRQVTPVIIHRKPGLEDTIAAELRAGLTDKELRLPVPGDRLQFSA
jgi:ribonuclease BN (tRNA processing enzyme)